MDPVSLHFVNLVKLNKQVIVDIVQEYHDTVKVTLTEATVGIEQLQGQLKDAEGYASSLEDRNDRLEAEVRRLGEVTSDQSKAFSTSTATLSKETRRLQEAAEKLQLLLEVKEQEAFCWRQRALEAEESVEAKGDTINTLKGENLDRTNEKQSLERKVNVLQGNIDRQATNIRVLLQRGRLDKVEGLRMARDLILGHDHQDVMLRRAITNKITELEGK